MSESLEVKVPDIGDFTDVPVVELLVAAGEEVEVDQALLVLESDKASIEIPAPQAGKIAELKVAVGDTVSEGTVLLVLEAAGAERAEAPGEPEREAAPEPPAAVEAQATVRESGESGESGESPEAARSGEQQPVGQPGEGDDFERGEVHAQVLVLGSGPGGYAAAFRAADLGLEVVLVERHETLGGVCLNVGCIPSKALLHVAKVIAEAETMSSHGVSFGKPKIALDELRGWKDSVVDRLVGGVTGMASGRKVNVVRGEARFTSPHHLTVVAPDGEGETVVSFDSAIVAAGSRPVRLPGFPGDDDRIMDSTGALELADVPKRLLVVGGGIIGLEMATVYDALGSKVTVVELADQLIPGCDPDLVKPLHKRIAARYEAIHLGTKVEEVKALKSGLKVKFSGDVEAATFDRILVAVGRIPNGAGLGLDAAGVEVGERGFIPVDDRQRTNIPHIYAIGDIAGQPMLAHKATAEGHIAAEVVAGHDVVNDVRGIPSVAYTDPEVAWVGLTETEAKAGEIAYETAVFPWSASGRALAIDGAEGRTKLLYDPESRRLLGAGIVGPGAGELLAEIGLALEMGADIGDVALTVHAHPTLSESVMLAAELAEGTITDLPNKRRRSG